MSVQRGKLFLLKAGDGGSPETFTTVGKLRATSITINGTTVDIDNKDGGGYQELLDQGGIVSLQVTASGIFEDSASQTVLASRALVGSINNYQLVSDGGRTIECGFIVTQWQRQGDYNNAEQYNVTLASSGTPTVA